MSTVRLADGVDLHYERRGEGPDVVLVSNFFMDSSSWRPFTGTLEKTCRLLAYDLRGQGASGGTLSETTWDGHLDDLAGLLSGLGIARAHLVGTSFSALLCRDAAIARPDLVCGLVLAGPALSPWGVRRHRRIIKTWLATLEAQGLEALYDQMYPLVSGDHAAEAAGTAGFLGRKQSFLALHTPDSIRAGLTASLAAPANPDLLREVRCPTLLFVGDDDFALGASAVEELTRLLPGGRSVTVPRAGHLPFLEEPGRFQQEVADFVAEVERDRG